jgi:hypothetical protein
LVAVEPSSLALLVCDRTGDRSGAAWQQALSPFGQLEFVIAEAAKGIAAGVQAVAAARAEQPDPVPLAQGLDLFHTAQEARRVLAGPWRRAEAAWEEAEAADACVVAHKRQGQDARGVAQQARRAWEQAEQALAAVDQQEAAWQRARAALEIFRPDGTLPNRDAAAAALAAALTALQGPEWKKVRNFLSDPRSLAFLDRLHTRVAEVQPHAEQRQAWVRRWWWLRHRRPRAAPVAAPTAGERVRELLDEVLRQRRLSAEEQAAYDRVAAVLRTTVRASSAVEGINSVLRMQQCRHRQMTPGLLDLKRLYWNCRRLPTGPRRDRCPYELLGARLPSTDFWRLLQTPPQQLTQELSTLGLQE